MKLRIGNVEVEGTIEEVMAYQKLLNLAPASGAKQHDPATDEDCIRRYVAEAPMTPGRAADYAAIIHRLKARVAPRSVMSATNEDIKSFVEETLARCRHLYTFNDRSRTPGWCRCEKGRFDRDVGESSTIPVLVRGPGAKPAFCGASCPDFDMSAFSATTLLRACTSFFTFFEDEITSHPSRKLATHYHNTLNIRERSRERYCPELETVVQIVKAVSDDPELLALVVLLAKSGRRSGELRLMEWPHVDLEKGWIDLDHVRQKKLRLAGRGRTKMHRYSCRYLFLDDEAIRVLRAYRAWWLLKVKKDAVGNPVSHSIWLNRNRSGPVCKKTLQTWCEKALEKAGLLAVHGRKQAKRLTPHCFRHFFTTITQRGPFKAARSLVKFLRGDIMGDAMQGYEHIPPEEIRLDYLKCAPQLGV